MTLNSNLLERVKDGNNKLGLVWLKAIKLPEPELDKQMARIDKSWPLLHTLCQQLKSEGFSSCLYNPGEKESCEKPFVCWVCTRECLYESTFHLGKIEWHHPISSNPEIGLSLCEAHHSLIKDRKKLYDDEFLATNKSLEQMKGELKQLEADIVIKSGHSVEEIDKC